MAVSKRVRYEVLRRDNFACRYCGAKAPYVELHVDHVIPRRLGGTDDAWNLTAACAPCNWGKRDGVPTDEVILEVRTAETHYLSSKGGCAEPCMYCARPVIFELGDERGCPQCQPCNEAVSEAYMAGRKAGANL